MYKEINQWTLSQIMMLIIVLASFAMSAYAFILIKLDEKKQKEVDDIVKKRIELARKCYYEYKGAIKE